MGRIQRFNFATDEIISIDLSTPGNKECKVIMLIKGPTNLRIAYDESGLSYAYITLEVGQTYVFDGPNPFKTNMFFKSPGGDSVLETWVAGGGGMY